MWRVGNLGVQVAIMGGSRCQGRCSGHLHTGRPATFDRRFNLSQDAMVWIDNLCAWYDRKPTQGTINKCLSQIRRDPWGKLDSDEARDAAWLLFAAHCWADGSACEKLDLLVAVCEYSVGPA
jgi:hypothetical protein